MTSKLIPVVLCGGSGTRLWPYSRAEYPKQFLSFGSPHTLLQNTIARMCAVESFGYDLEPPLILCNEDHRFVARDQLQQIGIKGAKVILEPVSRNTAPAITLAAFCALDYDEESIVLIAPSDHHIPDDVSFLSTLNLCIKEAEAGAIALIGIVPTKPETGYGYIKVATDSILESEPVVARNVEGFVEKPDLLTAEQFLIDGKYLWNAGIFVVRASVWLNSVNKLAPQIYNYILSSWRNKSVDGDFVRPDAKSFATVENVSADYAVIEKCKGINQTLKVVPYNDPWSDLGAWDAVWHNGKMNEFGNVISGDAVTINSVNNLVYAQNRLVVLSGVENLAVIETSDAILVTERSKSQDVKFIVNQLSDNGRTEHLKHREVHRPWGSYDTLDFDSKFQVKKISVNPGGFLSLQKHQHRAEHWIVVKGTAEVTRGEDTFLLAENESTYIPLGVVHRLRNPTDETLEIIEVQSGDYLGEDDIVRLDDLYGRH